MSGPRRGGTGWAARFAWGLLALSASLALAAFAIALAGRGGLLVASLSAVLTTVFGATGAVLASRLPRNPIGWFFCAFAVLSGLSAAGDAYVSLAGAPPGRVWAAWTIEWSVNALSPALVALAFLLFPTGRPPSARWRPLAWAVVLAAGVHALSSALAPGRMSDYPFENPAGLAGAPWLRGLAEGSLLLLVAPLVLVSAASLFVRMRGADGVQRQQIKWFAYAAAMMALLLVALNASRLLLGEPGRTLEALSFVLFALVLSSIPVSMAIAILRYRLYDIDLLINRTLVYATLSATLVGIYLVVVVLLQYPLAVLTGEGSQLAIVASTLLVAALFSPLRRRLQGSIDRLFYREKYDAARTLEAFSGRLRDETDLPRLCGDLASVARDALRPAHVSVWILPRREKSRTESLR